ncbi:MAG: hypothetical protein H6717_14820 [Polyangiaceae bacterium]|nr:hypothetical protein [Polyangiaceae bacterium]
MLWNAPHAEGLSLVHLIMWVGCFPLLASWTGPQACLPSLIMTTLAVPLVLLPGLMGRGFSVGVVLQFGLPLPLAWILNRVLVAEPILFRRIMEVVHAAASGLSGILQLSVAQLVWKAVRR